LICFQVSSRKRKFYEQVKELFEKKQKIAMDQKFDDGTEIRIDKLQAVNGVFSSDFSTC
jgi:hypothetical protein